MLIWTSPAGREFMDEAISFLERGEDIRLVVPARLQAGLAPALASRCRERGLEAAEARESAADALGDGQGDGYVRTQAIAGPERALGGWIGRDRLWSAAIIVEPGEGSGGCAAISWWGRMDLSDIARAAKTELRRLGVSPAAFHWHKAMCLALCETDIGMIPDCIAAAPCDAREIAEFLEARPECSKESGKLVRRFYRNPGNIGWDAPPEEGPAFDLWKAGLLDVDDAGRPMVHRAALLAAGMYREIRQAVVFAQSLVYSPLLHETHSLICRRMDFKKGPGWDGLEAKDNQYHKKELTPLLSYLQRHCPQAAEREIEAAKIWGDVRHCTAHCNMLPPELAMKAWLAHDSLKR